MCFVCAAAALEEENNPGHIQYNETDQSLYQAANSTVSVTYSSSEYPSDYTSAVLAGYSWSSSAGEAATVTYSFNTSNADTSIVYSNNYRDFTSAEQATTEQVLDRISEIANITFQETSSSDADIVFYVGDLYSQYNAAGLAGYYVWGDDTYSHTSVGVDTDYSDFESGGTSGYDYLVLLHEIGHVLGLKHSGNYGASDSGPVLPSSLDSYDYTVMSYNTGAEGYVDDYQQFDIEALQYLYGTASGYVADDDTTNYTDSGSGAATDDTVTISNLTGAEGYGGLGSDTIYGNTGNDTIYGGRAIADAEDSADIIEGRGGNDEMYGNTGNDTIYGGWSTTSTGTGADTVYGGLGEDDIYGHDGDDYLAGGGGIAHPNDDPDTINAGEGNDFVIGNGGGDLLYLGEGNDTVYGGLDGDYIYGEAGNDYIVGQNGNDFMHGGSGADTFFFYSDNDSDIVSSFSLDEDIVQLQSNLNGSGITSVQDALDAFTYSSGNTAATLEFSTGDEFTLYFETAGTLTAANIEIV